MTIKIENGKYYVIFNIETEIPEFPKTNEFVGIDLGMRTLATLDNGLKIANLDVSYEENMIKKYAIIILEDLNIKGMFQNPDHSSKLQKIAWKKFVKMLKYKAEIYGKTLRQISRWYPSSKICSNCGYYNKDLKYETEWKCPQ